jgi:hypothetical protein
LCRLARRRFLKIDAIKFGKKSMENNNLTLALALDRMVDHLLVYDEMPFLDLVQKVWRKQWNLDAAPFPANADPLRLALSACLLERMAEVWSQAPKNTPSTPPAWCQTVPALAEPFSVISPEFMRFWEGETGAPIFAKRNIFAPTEFMYFL